MAYTGAKPEDFLKDSGPVYIGKTPDDYLRKPKFTEPEKPGFIKDFVVPTIRDIAVGVPEAAMALSTPILTFPGELLAAAGTSRLQKLQGVTDPKKIRQEIDVTAQALHETLDYQPKSEAAHRLVEPISKAFEFILKPAQKLDKALSDAGHPVAGYVVGKGAELATFAVLHKARTAAVNKVKASKGGVPKELKKAEVEYSEAINKRKEVLKKAKAKPERPLAELKRRETLLAEEGKVAPEVISEKPKLKPPIDPERAELARIDAEPMPEQILDWGDGAKKAPKVPTLEAPKKATPAEKNPWDLTRDELYKEHEKVKTQEANLESNILGKDLKAWEKAQRELNSSNNKISDKALDTIDNIESKLPKSQRDKLYGIGEKGRSAEQLKTLLDDIDTVDGSSVSSLASSISKALTDVNNKTNPAKMNSSELGAYLKIKEAHKIAGQKGFNLKELSDKTLKSAAKRFSDPADAKFMLKSFLKEQPSAPKKAAPSMLEDINTALGERGSLTGKITKAQAEARARIKQRSLDVIDQVKDTIGDAGKSTDSLLGALSTRLANIDPKLKGGMRKFEYKTLDREMGHLKSVEPFLQKVKKMNSGDRKAFDFARKNADGVEEARLVKKYGMEAEQKVYRLEMDKIREAAIESGLNVPYRKNYHPRMAKDPAGLLRYLGKADKQGIINKYIAEREKMLSEKEGTKVKLTAEQRGEFIAEMIDTYDSGKLNLLKLGNLKARTIPIITEKINRFLMGTDEATVGYVHGMAEAIEARKFIGKGENLSGSISEYVERLVSKRKITPEQELEVIELLNSRFNQKGMSAWARNYKNIELLSTLGQFKSALTQVKDLGLSSGVHGFRNSAQSAMETLMHRNRISTKDLGISRIAQEFEGSGGIQNVVNKTFTATGLKAIDLFGKNTSLNAALIKGKRLANSPKKVGAFKKELRKTYGKETEALIEDLKNDVVTENTKLYAFNELLDLQPVALSEMPVGFLRGGNGRLFYTLKSYDIKQWDVFRTKVIQKVKNPETRAEGLKTLGRLTFSLSVLGATVDEMKDVLSGKKSPFTDKVINNLMNIIGLGKYQRFQSNVQGLGKAFASRILPPTSIADRGFRDVTQIAKGKRKLKDAELVRSIPLVGELTYQQVGGGKKKRKRRKSSGGFGSLGD